MTQDKDDLIASLEAQVAQLTQAHRELVHTAKKVGRDAAGTRAELTKLREGGEPVPVEYMVQRFLQWKLPVDFSPDGGIQFVKQTDYGHVFEPVGTNLLDYTQAKAMVLHMLDGAAIATTEQTDTRSGVAIKALRSIAEGNLGDAPWQANYARIRQVAADALEALSPAAPEGRQEAVAEITQGCRYCANTGWFYGDPDLGTYCGCAFGKVREEASTDRPTERAVTEAWRDRIGRQDLTTVLDFLSDIPCDVLVFLAWDRLTTALAQGEKDHQEEIAVAACRCAWPEFDKWTEDAQAKRVAEMHEAISHVTKQAMTKEGY